MIAGSRGGGAGVVVKKHDLPRTGCSRTRCGWYGPATPKCRLVLGHQPLVLRGMALRLRIIPELLMLLMVS